ncbi:MAG: hypothetical protein ACRDGJ_05785 [Candidatus Limnocylindria bacterium]
MSGRIGVYLEIAGKRTFACAIAWPGWSRSGKTPDLALEALLASAPRYARVVRASGLGGFGAPGAVSDLEVVERLEGGSGTDFGVPSATPGADRERLSDVELARQAVLLEASWSAFDTGATAARGVELRKGPRGGGRDLDKIVEHVLEAERAYLTQLGSRAPMPDETGTAAQMTQIREWALDALARRARDEPLAEPNRVKRPWLPRYFVRRSAWHALDHAWEIEDRAVP